MAHKHETQHKGNEVSRVERWLSRETHKAVAEFCILVTAATVADVILRAVHSVVLT